MGDLIIGKGKLAGKGVYTNRDFKKNEIVTKYNLKPLTKKEYKKLPRSEKMFTYTLGTNISLLRSAENRGLLVHG